MAEGGGTGGSGSKLEDFRLMCKLGEGTFSEVLKVKHKKNGKIFAMKRFRKHFQSMEEIEGLREIQALRRLNPHQNVIDLEDVIFDPKHGILSLNFDLMDCNLYELISKKHAPITEMKGKVYMHQICKGLEYMHGKGIFHRDIKPENILIKDTVVKIGDFGSCRGIHSKPPYTEYIATRWYRSPECLLCDGIYNFKMDMWGAGCVLYEMITRVPLFPGANELDQLHRIHAVLGTPTAKTLKALMGNRANQLKFQFPPKEGCGIRSLLPQVSTECIDLTISLLAYSPDDRITARESLRHPFFKDVHLIDLKTSNDAFTTQSISVAKTIMASNPKLGLPKEEPKEEEHPVIVAPPAASTTSTHTYLKAPKQKQPSHQSDSGSNAGVGPTDHHPPKPVDHEPSAFLQKFKRDMDEKRAAEAALVKARRAKRHSGAHPAGLTASARRRQQPTAPQNSVVAPAPDKNTNGYKLPSIHSERSPAPPNNTTTTGPRNLPALNPTHNASDAEKGRKHAPSNQTKESVLLPSLTNPPKPTASNPSLHISEPSTLPSLKQGHGQPPAHTGLR